ncbi:MAG TPA: branched-chain amino acid ABC transporter permease [Thermodesulfobacteriota bacterium]|nr:branched-chain amino acid ABC transporter permease [Thermodesulfobacteriota bacterium]
MADTIQVILIYTFVLGSLYLLISLGFSVVCGVLRVFHMGYGVTFVVAVYCMWMLMKEFHFGLVPAVIGMFVIQTLFTLGIIYFPVVKRYIEQEELLLTSLILISLIVEEAANFFYPVTAGVNLPTTILPGAVKIGPASIPIQMLIASGVAILTTAVFVLFLLKTRRGLVIRAVSQDTESAELMGANVGRVYALAMVLSVIPPTICILIIAPVWSIEPSLGLPLMMTSILVAILGGLGNIRGSIMASYIVGFLSSAVAFSINPRMMGLATLITVFIVLIFRPEGIAKSESLW